MRAAVIAEDFLETGDNFSSARLARWNRTARAGIAALQVHFADAEAHRTAFFCAEEVVLPERGHAIDFERSAEALAGFVEVHTREQLANRPQARGGNNRGAVSDGVVGKTLWGMAHGDGQLEEVGKPFGCRCCVTREGKCGGWNLALVAGNRKRDGAEVWRESRADQVDCRGALAIHPLAVNGAERPGAVVLESAAWPDARFLYMHRIERLDGMKANVGEARRWNCRNHGKSLAEGNWEAADGRRLRLLSGDTGRAEEQPSKKNSAHERQRDTQQRANQNVLGKTHGLEFWIPRDGFRGENQPHGRRRSQEQRGENQEPLEPADVQPRVLQLLSGFPELFIFHAFCQGTRHEANQITAAEDHSDVDHRHGEKFGPDAPGSLQRSGERREGHPRREQPGSENHTQQMNELISNVDSGAT